MNLLNTPIQLMMSSREIADLTNKDHGNVMRDIRAMINTISTDSNLNPCANSTTYTGSDGRQYAQYELDKDTCLTLLLGYDATARMRVVKRWQVLEAEKGMALPQTMAQALRLAADQAEQIEQQQVALALAAPKVEYVDRYVSANGAMGFRQVAKLLNAKEPEFRAFLEDSKILYRLGGVLTPYQNHIDAGRFAIKTGVSQQNEHAFAQARFTPKGVNWIAGEWAKHKLEQQVAA